MVNGGLMSYIVPTGIHILTVGFKFLRKNREYNNKGVVEPVSKMFWTKK